MWKEHGGSAFKKENRKVVNEEAMSSKMKIRSK